ncbi:O-methyltransferase [Paenibacillus sp. JX-17]|uniref:O-methyltransferase n=1 Tax=Paenibacillus lacisoli TaxID=3064525 RepID=A0ABT9CEW4_9BACL|nr:O-methyltransferase [Paenibacillus sp. JX-17]MDO7907792.1 O-methyltransferase [Paenibacillus sp. JX-17]
MDSPSSTAHEPNVWSRVDDYINERLIPQDSVLREILYNNRRANLPDYDVTPAQGKLLNLMVRMQGARRILEIGTLGAYSTVWMARALPEEGRIITLELDPRHAAVAKANLALAGVDHRVEVREGDAPLQLANMVNEGEAPFDMIFIDADKPNNPVYLQYALQLSRPGTLIIGDNVIRDGQIIHEHHPDPRVQGVQQFFDMLAQSNRITATAIQTVGSKGYDGFMIGIVNS